MIPAIIAGAVSLAGMAVAARQQKKQEKANMKLAQFQADANEKYLQQQLEYNSPESQMRRFQEAGLNPNLIYGQGNPGNQSAPLSYPNIATTDYQRLMQAIPLINQTAMTVSQVQANDAKIRKDTVIADLNRLQAQVVAKNPLLNDEGYKATIDSLRSAAEIKASQSSVLGQQAGFLTKSFKMSKDGEYYSGTVGEYKLWREMDLLDQKFKLNSLDGKLKAEVLTSKEFQNAILEVQKKWMTDAEITPQHIFQFITALLMKSL